MTYSVLWNGCKDHPNGPHLFVERYTPSPSAYLPEPSKAPRVYATETVLAMRQQMPEWFTTRDVRRLTDLSAAQVQNAINNLRRQGLMERELIYTRISRGQRYRWVIR